MVKIFHESNIKQQFELQSSCQGEQVSWSFHQCRRWVLSRRDTKTNTVAEILWKIFDDITLLTDIC